MGLFKTLAGFSAAGLLFHLYQKRYTYDSTVSIDSSLSKKIQPDDRVSFDDFCQIVDLVALRIKKRLISYYIDNTSVTCTIRSKSGLTDWKFKVTFLSYNRPTCIYFIVKNENPDSSIPIFFANSVSEGINGILKRYYIDSSSNRDC